MYVFIIYYCILGVVYGLYNYNSIQICLKNNLLDEQAEELFSDKVVTNITIIIISVFWIFAVIYQIFGIIKERE